MQEADTAALTAVLRIAINIFLAMRAGANTQINSQGCCRACAADGQTPDLTFSKLIICADSWGRAHIAACSAVVGVAIDIGLTSSAGGDDGPITGHARLVAVGAEASVVGLAIAAQVAGLCTAFKALRHHHVTSSFNVTVHHSVLTCLESRLADVFRIGCGWSVSS